MGHERLRCRGNDRHCREATRTSGLAAAASSRGPLPRGLSRSIVRSIAHSIGLCTCAQFGRRAHEAGRIRC
ncbi:hypothetical protein A33M_3749 [Rhodovulum sp. PH10]|nr:hypothetical protein A33M_3749 [Rhodovulum sp. PH10]